MKQESIFGILITASIGILITFFAFTTKTQKTYEYVSITQFTNAIIITESGKEFKAQIMPKGVVKEAGDFGVLLRLVNEYESNGW